MSDQDSQASPVADSEPAKQQAAFRINAILKIVVPIALLMGAGLVFFGVYDGAQWLSDAAKPALVKVDGRVVFNGKPVPDAAIETRPVTGNLRGAIGTGDHDGKFKLLTQLRGDFLDGAYVGEHQVTVKGYDMHAGMSLGPPPLLTPGKYASFATSPLRITVAEGQTEIVLELEGEVDQPAPAEPRARAYGNRQRATGQGDGDKDAGGTEEDRGEEDRGEVGRPGEDPAGEGDAGAGDSTASATEDGDTDPNP